MDTQQSLAINPSKFRLFLVVIFGNVSSFTLGTCIAWPSPMIPKFVNKTDDSPISFKIDVNQMGWIFSLISIGALCAALIAGPLADRIGRKTTMMVGSCMFILAYLTMICANSIEIIYLGRVLEGLGAGCTMTVIPMYVGEIATKESRGSALSLMMLFMTLGMLYVYCIGPFTRYLVLQFCCLAFPLLTFWGYCIVPESPHYLVKRDRIDEAVKALQTIRGQSAEAVRGELLGIQEAAETAKTVTKGRCKDITSNPANMRALIIAIGLMSFQQFSGVVILIINSQSIFFQANSSISSAYAAIIVGVVQVFFSSSLQLVVDWWKRRTLLRLSATGMCIAQFTLGTFFFIQAKGDTTNFRWIPLVAFILFQMSYRIGFGPLPITILGELFPPNIKSVAATSVTITCWGLGFCIAKMYPLLDVIGAYYVYWMFSICCVLAFLFVQFVVMETHGLSLNEIQERLQKLTQ